MTLAERTDALDAELAAASATWRRAKAARDAADDKDDRLRLASHNAWWALHAIIVRGGDVYGRNPVFLGQWLLRHGLDPFHHSSAIALAMGRKRNFSDAAFAKLFKPIVEAEGRCVVETARESGVTGGTPDAGLRGATSQAGIT